MAIRRDLGIGSELKEFVEACLERLKVIFCWEDGRRKRVPVSRCHRDKRDGECVCSVSIQFVVLRPRKSCIQNKSHGSAYISVKKRKDEDIMYAL